MAALEHVVRETNQVFMTFEETATKSQTLDPRLAGQLRQTSNHLAQLAGEAAHQLEEVKEVAGPKANILDAREVVDTHIRQSSLPSAPEPAPSWGYGIDPNYHHSRAANLTPDIGHPGSLPAILMDDTPVKGPTSLVADCKPLSWQAPSTADAVMAQNLSDNRPSNAESFRNDNPGPQLWQQWSLGPQQQRVEMSQTPDMATPSLTESAIPKELPLPRSYSHQETSFTRRLMRSSLEASYRLLTSTHPNPDELARLTTYSLCLTKFPKVVKLFQQLLGRTVKENLELWHVPLLHVGGAGLHYPRDGIDASSQPPEWWANQSPMGPSRPLNPEKIVSESLSNYERVDYAGVGGEWFDSNDVEQYLRTKGLQLDSHSSIVEYVEPEADLLPDVEKVPALSSTTTSSSYDSSGGPQSPENAWPPTQPSAFADQMRSPWYPPSDEKETDTATETNGFFDAKVFDPGFDFSMLQPSLPATTVKPKRVVDVDAFLNSKHPRTPVSDCC